MGERHRSSSRISRSKLRRLDKLAIPVVSTVVAALLLAILLPLANPVGDWIAKWRTNFLKHDPDNTFIIQAIDGNHQIVQMDGQTPSPIIKFSFIAYKGPHTDNVDVATKTIDKAAKFECKLGYNKPFSECLPEYQNLPRGPHLFQVRVNDTNSNKPPEPAKFNFTVIPSVLINGWLMQNNTPVTNNIVIMDDKFKSLASDSTGNFAYPYIEYRRDVILHNFTIHIIVQGQQTVTCSITKNINADNPYDRIDLKPPFNLDSKICPKEINLRLPSSSTTTSNKTTDFFKPEVDYSGRNQYANIDLRYNVTLVREPTTINSNDGLWNIVIYLKGPDTSKVSKIIYYLHPTFRPNVITLNQRPDNPTFSLPLSAYGGFKLYSKAYLDDGRKIDFSRFIEVS